MNPQGESNTMAVGTTDRKFFTLEEANASLPYVQRVVDDIRTTYRIAVALQQRMESPLPTDDTAALGRDYTANVDKLNGYVEELAAVGAELKDYDLGLIDFPAMHDGREVCLCWKHGESDILAWHEVDTGFAGRQSIETLEIDDDDVV